MREEKLRNARLYNNDKNPIHLPRQHVQKSLKSPVISRVFKFADGVTTPLLHQ